MEKYTYAIMSAARPPYNTMISNEDSVDDAVG